MYIIVCDSCPNCDRKAIMILEHLPTEEEIGLVKDSIGGMFCIKTKIFSAVMGEIVSVPYGD